MNYKEPIKYVLQSRQDFCADLKALLSLCGMDASEQKLSLFADFTEHLLTKNSVMNLTGIVEPHEIIIKHYLDSLLPFKDMPLSGKKIIDIGTGAGFPGVPLLIMHPDAEISLLDSTEKRISFIKEALFDMNIAKCRFEVGRAEEKGREKALREQFDIAAARAVAPLNILAEFCLPFVKKGGYFIAFKGKEIEDEIKAAEKGIAMLGGRVKEINSFCLPEGAGERTAAIIEKISETPEDFPRNGGKIKKSPL